MDPFRIVAVVLDEHSVATRDPMIARERQQAIYDLLVQNHFKPFNSPGGPYRLILSVKENRLHFDIRLAHDRHVPHGQIILALSPLRRVIRDYFLVCENHRDAVRTSPLQQIETLDMGRRALHDEGATLLRQRLEGKIAIDFETARRHYLDAIRLNPRYADAYFNLALLCERNNDLLQAVGYWQSYLKLDSTSSWASAARKQLERLKKAVRSK